MKHLMIFALITLTIGCSKNRPKDCISISDFNQRSRDAFLNDFDSYDLGPMNDLDKCILKKGITNYLDKLNNWKLSVIDSFYVRGYDFENLGIHFSFVATSKGRYYFIYLPRLTKYTVHNLYEDDYYDYGDNNSLVLKDSLNLIISKINSSMLDDFFKTEVFSSGNFNDQYKHADRLLKEFFPYLSQEIHLYSLEEELANEPGKNREHIMKSIKPIIERKATVTEGSSDFRLYRLRPFGWIMVDYFLADSNQGSISVDIYFIASKRAFLVTHDTETNKYKECYD